MFNPKYGILGIISYPFWLFFEWLAPIIEFFGMLYFLALAIMGWINWSHFFLLLALVYSFAILISWFTILIEEVTYREYKGFSSLLKLQVTALFEPLLFHSIGVIAAIRGNWDKFVLKKNTWGVQVRKGFKTIDKK